LVTVF